MLVIESLQTGRVSKKPLQTLQAVTFCSCDIFSRASVGAFEPLLHVVMLINSYPS